MSNVQKQTTVITVLNPILLLYIIKLLLVLQNNLQNNLNLMIQIYSWVPTTLYTLEFIKFLLKNKTKL